MRGKVLALVAESGYENECHGQPAGERRAAGHRDDEEFAHAATVNAARRSSQAARTATSGTVPCSNSRMSSRMPSPSS